MPQPRQATAPPPRQSSARGETLAVAATGAAATAAAATPAATELAAIATTAAAAAAVAKRIAEALMRFGRKRQAAADEFTLTELRRRYPDRPLREAREIVDAEAEYEEAFRRKQALRVQGALREALAEPDEAVRAARINAFLEAEKRYVRLRESAMLARSISRNEQRLLMESSPAGAYWKLSPYVREHTLDCLMMGERFWPWTVLREMAPPLHYGCPCALLGLDEAIAEGLMTANQVPNARDAHQAFRDIRDQLDGLEETFGIIVVDEDSLSEDGLDPHDWIAEAALAIDDESEPPIGGWDQGIQFEHGPPADPDIDSNLVQHAKRELHLAGLDRPDSDYDGMIADAVLDMVRTHSREGHSGFSSAMTLSVLNRLLNYENLTPLTDDPAEWINHGKQPGDARYPKGMWQNSRNGRAFSADGGKTYKLLDDRTPGGRKQDKTYTSAPKSSKRLEEADDQTIGTSRIDRPRLTKGSGHRRHRLRWEKGWVKGGQFKPKRGAASNRSGIRLKARLKITRPKSPATNTRARWQFVAGTYTQIPEASRWERNVDGVKYSSPPGSTNVYREGRLIATPTADLHPDARRRGREKPAIAVPEIPAEKAEALDALRDQMRATVKMRAEAATSAATPSKPPVVVGDGPEALAALREAGYRVNASTGLYGGRTEFVHPSGARLRIRVDRRDYSVREVSWEPNAITPRAPRRRLDRPPESWEGLVADALALADRVGKEYDAEVLVPEIHVDAKLEDHAGNHDWNGVVRIGKEAPMDIEYAAKVRAEGRPLDEFEARGLYATYRTLAHEVLGHGVNPIDASGYESGGRHLEEALAEENAVLDTHDWLERHKLSDVLAWADANASNITVAGSYLHERGALASLIDQAGVTKPDERIKLLRELKYRTPPAERMNHLGLLVFDEDQRSDEPNFEDLAAAVSHVELTMDHAADDVRPRGVMWGRPKTVSFSPAKGNVAVSDVPDELADQAVAQAGRAYQPAIDRIAELDPGTGDAAALALKGDRYARWELAQRAELLGPAARAQIEAAVGPIGNPSHGIGAIRPDQVDDFLAGATWGSVMHYGADREVATKLLSGKALVHDPGHKYRLFGTGFYGTSSPKAAKYAPRMRGPKGAVVDLAVRLDHPLVLDDDASQTVLGDVRTRASERFDPGSTDHADYVRTSLLAAGYDGVVRHFIDGETWAVALEPDHQVAAVEARKVPSLRPYRPILGTQRETGPDVAAGRAQVAGALVADLDPLAPSLGTGARFTAGDGGQRIELNEANLYHPRDGGVALELHDTLRDLDDYAERGIDDPRLDGIADRLPHGGDTTLAREAARQAVERHREARERRDVTADTAATEAMRALGWDGVDVRHVDGFPAESVLYRRREPEAMGSPAQMDSAVGGAVVGGVAGRWVWIRGTYRHIPHGSAYNEVADGVLFHSPAGSTEVYRFDTPEAARPDTPVIADVRRAGGMERLPGRVLARATDDPTQVWITVRYPDGRDDELLMPHDRVGIQVARPRWTNHPDVRRPPAGQSTRRRRGQATTRRRPVAPPPPPPPPPFVDPRPPTPFLSSGEPPLVGMLVEDGTGRVGRIRGISGTDMSIALPDETTVSGVRFWRPVLPEVAEDQRVRVHSPDGRDFLGTVRQVSGSMAVVELDNGELIPGGPYHLSALEVLADAPRRPDGAPPLTNDDMIDLMGARPTDAQDGAELVPGVRYSRALLQPVTANKLPAEILVGPSFFDLSVAARTYAMTNAQGYGLWNSIEGDEDALHELSAMWTDGRLSAEVDGRRVHLDRYSLPAAVAAGYAKLNVGDWRAAGALYPDSLRWIALQADRRGYPLPDGVLEWAQRTEIGGANEDDPAAVLARSLEGQQYMVIVNQLTQDGWRSRYSRVAGGGTLFTKVENGDVRVIEILHDASGGTGVASIRGYTHARPAGDDPLVTLVNQSRGRNPEAAGRVWVDAGWRYLGVDYGGRGIATLLVSEDGTREARLIAEGGSSDRQIVDIVVGPLSEHARAQWLASLLRSTDVPDGLIGQPEASLRRQLSPTGSNWTVVHDEDGWLTVERLINANTSTANAEMLRFRLEDGRVAEAGRPSAGDRSMAPNDDEYQRRIEARVAGLRREAAAREARIRELAERIRIATNEGREPFAGGEDYEEVRKAFTTMRDWDYGSSPRSLNDGGTSVTFKNTRTGAKLILRRDAPDDNGIIKVRADSRVTASREPDLGRTRTTGRLPATRHEWEADALGRSDEHRRAERADQNDIERVHFYFRENEAEYAVDHAGVHQSGRIGIGARALPDLLEAQQAIAAGQTLTDDQCSRVYASYKVLQHEINHGVRGEGSVDYADDGGKGIEEALVEELAHVEMVEWLRSHGLEQVVAWSRRVDQRGAGGIHQARLNGSYLTHRQNFRRVLERAGMIDDPELANFMRRLKYRTNGFARRRVLGDAIARHEGISEADGLAAVLQIMRGDHDTGNQWVANFQPILHRERARARAPIDGPDTDTDDTEGGGPRADIPDGSRWRNGGGNTFTATHRSGQIVMTFDSGQQRTVTIEVFQEWVTGGGVTRESSGHRRIGDHVKVRPMRGRGFRGRIIEVGTGENAGKVKVRKIGRGEEVWAEAARTTLVDRAGNPLPDRDGTAPPPGPTPPRPRPDAPYALGPDGRSMLGIGAIYRGTSTGKLGTITGISDSSTATVRRADNTTYTGASTQFTPVVITNEGYELKVGDRVLRESGNADVYAIDYRDPQRPLVQFTAGGEWVDGRTLEPARPPALATVRSVRTGGNIEVVKGARVKLRDGTIAEVLGPRLTTWPLGRRTIRVRVNGQERSITNAEIVGVAGELPGVPQGFRVDADAVHALQMAHFRRQGTAKRRAVELMAPLNAQLADQVEEWWRAQGLPVSRGRAKVANGRTFAFDRVLAEAYGSIFESRDADASMNATLRRALTDIAGAAGFPPTDWSDDPQRPLRPGQAPPGTMFDDAVLRATWTGQFGRTGMTTVVDSVTTNGRIAEVKGRILNRNGTGVGTFTRNVKTDADGNPFVYHAYLSINRRSQGGGFASAFNRHAEAIYRAKGVKYVKVGADLDVGGYAWAATGFDFEVHGTTPEARASSRAVMCRRYLDQALSSRVITRAEYDGVVGRFVDPTHFGAVPEGKIQHAWELAAVGGRGAPRDQPQTIGQRMLLNKHWPGIKHLVGPERSPMAGSPAIA